LCVYGRVVLPTASSTQALKITDSNVADFVGQTQAVTTGNGTYGATSSNMHVRIK